MRVAVIGASRGVGRHITERLCREGTKSRPLYAIPPIWRCGTAFGSSLVTPSGGCWRGNPGSGCRVLHVGPTPGIRRPCTRQRPRTSSPAAPAHVRRLVFLSNFGVLDETASDLIGSLMLVLVRRVTRQHWPPSPRTPCNGPQRRRVDRRSAHDADKWPADWQLPRRSRRMANKGRSIARADVADFMLNQAQDKRYLGLAPAIAYRAYSSTLISGFGGGCSLPASRPAAEDVAQDLRDRDIQFDGISSPISTWR